ncbi:MAG: hypothetical protein JO347_05800 [Candidatus Eremiobacteraeota bacterium]|nr:hypothetical protein [Candidatus Eremiobacteraeota bacterium]
MTLLGLLDQAPMPLQIAGLHPSLKDTSLYLTTLPLQFQRGIDVTIPPALISTKQIGTFSTNFQHAPQYELNSSGSLALEFTLPLQASDMQANSLVLHMNGHYANVNNQRQAQPLPPGLPLGQVFLYNWQSSDWDAQDFSWGDNVVKDSGPYLSATSALRLRFTYKAPAQQASASIQFTLDLTDEGQLK